MPDRAGNAGKNAEVANSSGRSADSSGPTKKSAAAISRDPTADTAVTEPPVSASTVVSSPDGSACASDPTDVPRLRMVGCATSASACGSSGCTRPAAGVPLDPAVPGQRPDPHPGGVDGHRVQRGDPVDVDQVRGFGQPHGQDRYQRLAAGQHLPVMADLGQQRDGLGHRLGAVPGEGRRFHPDILPQPPPVW